MMELLILIALICVIFLLIRAGGLGLGGVAFGLSGGRGVQ